LDCPLWIRLIRNLPSKSDYFLWEIDPTALEEGVKTKGSNSASFIEIKEEFVSLSHHGACEDRS